MTTTRSSTYMHWAKTAGDARWNLAGSGVRHSSLKDLEIKLDDLEINGVSTYGFQPLLEALAAKCRVKTDCVATAIGTSMANHLVMAALLEPGDHVLIEHPTYEPILAVARYLHSNITRFPRRFENAFQIDPDDVAKNLDRKTKLIVITNLHNPSGVFTPPEILKAIGKIAERSGAKILIDEVYLECLFAQPGTPSSSFHLGNQYIATGSLTKAYGLSGLRCGWILAEPPVIAQCRLMSDLFYASPPFITELLSVIALKKLPEIAERARRLLEGNRQALAQFLGLHANLLDVVLPQFSTVIFPRLRTGDTQRLIRILREEYDTLVVPGSFFEMPDHFRLGIGCQTEILEEGLKNIARALENF